MPCPAMLCRTAPHLADHFIVVLGAAARQAGHERPGRQLKRWWLCRAWDNSSGWQLVRGCMRRQQAGQDRTGPVSTSTAMWPAAGGRQGSGGGGSDFSALRSPPLYLQVLIVPVLLGVGHIGIWRGGGASMQGAALTSWVEWQQGGTRPLRPHGLWRACQHAPPRQQLKLQLNGMPTIGNR